MRAHISRASILNAFWSVVKNNGWGKVIHDGAKLIFLNKTCKKSLSHVTTPPDSEGHITLMEQDLRRSFDCKEKLT